jgi:hypothetical protein
MNLGKHSQKVHKPCPRSSQYEKLTTANKRKPGLANKLQENMDGEAKTKEQILLRQ